VDQEHSPTAAEIVNKNISAARRIIEESPVAKAFIGGIDKLMSIFTQDDMEEFDRMIKGSSSLGCATSNLKSRGSPVAFLA
jgi:hypothetical protein